jgi:hypothetical protein
MNEAIDYSLHLNLTQDIGHGMTLIFICAIAVLVAVLLDLSTGVEAARKNMERIKSKILRRTVTKILDYYRVMVFGVLIDVLGLAFPWYSAPYCAIVVTMSIILIEAKSVLENYRKMKSAAAHVPDMLDKVKKATTNKDAAEIIRIIKDSKNENE